MAMAATSVRTAKYGCRTKRKRMAMITFVTNKVRKFCHSRGRGLYRYGTPIRDINGGAVKVYDSSLATQRACWLNSYDGFFEVSVHLNEHQAKELIRRLLTWVDAGHAE
jgi:hypothetical protein